MLIRTSLDTQKGMVDLERKLRWNLAAEHKMEGLAATCREEFTHFLLAEQQRHE